MRVRLFRIVTFVLSVSNVAAALDKSILLAPQARAAIEQGPPIQCKPNETKEWRATMACGINDAGAPIGGEHRC